MRLLMLSDVMKSFRVAVFLKFGESVGWGKGYLQAAPAKGATPGNVHDMAAVLSVAEKMRAECMALGLSASVATCRKLVALAQRERVAFAVVKKLEDELHGRIVDETQEMVLLAVDPGRAEQFRGGHLFGEDVARVFRGANEDIEEAGKCLALDRGTACVFHLMRVMETGLRWLGTSLNDPALDPQTNPSWDRILSRGDKELAKPLKDRSLEWRQHEQFYATAHANLRAVKDAWRNPTMHIERRYSEEEAEDVWNATRGFMRHLAKGPS